MRSAPKREMIAAREYISPHRALANEHTNEFEMSARMPAPRTVRPWYYPPSSGFSTYQKVGKPFGLAPGRCLYRDGERESMKTHKTAPSNSQPFRRGSYERVITAVKTRVGSAQARRCGVKSNVAVKSSAARLMHSRLVQAVGGMRDVCGWLCAWIGCVSTPSFTPIGRGEQRCEYTGIDYIL